MTNHIYYYRNRPPGLFVQPDGFDPDTRESWSPRRSVDTPTGERSFLGKVEYSQPLTNDLIYKFELWPADSVEWAKHQVWDEARITGADSLWIFKDYADYMKENPNDPMIDEDIKFTIVRILQDAGINIETLYQE